MSNAHADDKIVTLRERFGMWGVGVYWSLVERVAEQMKGAQTVDFIPVAVFDVSELCSFCGCKRNKLETFLRCLRNIHGIKWERNGNIIKIEIQKLSEIKDNYHKDLEETSRQLPSKEGEEEVEEEVQVHKDKRVPLPAVTVLEHWNSEAERLGLTKILKLSDKRLKSVTARSSEKEFDLAACFKRIEGSSFLRGENDRGWKIDFDWLFCSSTNYLKLLEGKYNETDGRSNQTSRVRPPITADDLKRSAEMVERLADARKARGE